jgi:type IV secretory pathway VirB3-like protein
VKAFQAFLAELDEQRWDDHRFYHQSRINQSLHFVSAVSFIVAYVVVFFDPALAALLGWGVSMVTRQSGHFFFEPKGYDHANQATHEYKEEIKVGYNLRRKVVLMSVWLVLPAALWLSPSLGGLILPAADVAGYWHDVGLAWLALGVAALVFRMLQLFVQRDVKTGVIWAIKILTDPFVDARLYWKAPFYLMRGQLMDPAPNRR